MVAFRMILQLVLTLTFTTVIGSERTPIDMAFDDRVSFATIKKSDTGALTVIWGGIYTHRTSARGQINENVYPQKGYIYFPDENNPDLKNRTFFYYPDTAQIYWDSVREGNVKFWQGVPAPCFDAAGKGYSKGESYKDDSNKRCVCGQDGFVCTCDDTDVKCGAKQQKWTDQVTCISSCVPANGHCRSSGDPHYRSFDGKYFDFHGVCTYQAASCDDFQIWLKNYDLHGRAPRYTGRAEVTYKGKTFSIANNYLAQVDGVKVQLPYVKTYTNGDTIKIQKNGQLEIVLSQYSKDRKPAARVRASNAGRYINADIYLHGSCASLTEGLCGNFNGNSGDDLVDGKPNSSGNLYQKYDETCPAPPKPYHACDLVKDGKTRAAAICDVLKESPFSKCNSEVSYGDETGGAYYNCMTDVCNCFIDESCACSELDSYAQTCIENGVDLSNWREEVPYCPFKCPEGQTYMAAGPRPAPTCLERNPKAEGTVRGCFCPTGTFEQNGECVDANECLCLYEGEFFNVGDKIDKEGECQTCVCQPEGEMLCQKMSCPALECAVDEIKAQKDDECCPFCSSNWVTAINPEVVVEEGWPFTLECAVDARGGVLRKNIKWFKGEQELTSGISKDRLILKLKSAQADDGGQYTCKASKGDKAAEAHFKVTVKTPQIPKLVMTVKESIVNCVVGKRKCRVWFKVEAANGDKIRRKHVKICKLVDGKLKQCKKAKKRKKVFFVRDFGKVENVAVAGDYVAIVTYKKEDYRSEASTVHVEV